MQVLVTGGSGFIGANLCRVLVASDAVESVRVIDDLSTGNPRNLDGVDAELVEASILDEDVLGPLVSEADAVVHLAARPSVPRSIADPMASHRVNTDGTQAVLEAVRLGGAPQLVLASSSSVYGANPVLPKSVDLATRPVSPYAASKLAGEVMALAYSASFGIDVLAFRFFNVFGPLQPAGHAYAAVIPAFVDAALAGRPVPVHGDGRQSRDFTYVDTVAGVIERSLARGVASLEPVNLAYGSRTDLLGVLDLLEDVLGAPVARDHQDPRPGDVRDSQADDGPVRELFPDVDPLPLRTGLERTVDWFRTQV